METSLLLLLAIAPAIFWLWYFYSRDRYEPEPLSWIVLIYVFGIVVTIPVAITQGIIGLFLPEIMIAVLVAPVFEETAKYLVVRRTVYETREFNEPVDGIVYAAAAGLGFATLENVIYVFSALESSLALALQTGVVRAFISVPGHVLFSVMWGYALGRARFMSPGQRPAIILGGLVLAMAAHGLFNLLLYDALGFAVLILVVVPLLWLAVHRRIRDALAQSVFRPR
ncbi:MAG: PrsW family glutamic-type intramembrane protease [Methanoregulaceae archaeon]|jgi:RsiW-degrading membrane proteinase PrsW (M82 family)